MIDELYAYESYDPIEWKLTSETKIINDNYLVQKATTYFGGRFWTAWFYKDIAINEGPYKFRGLPGLIFQIYDSKGQFIYNLIQIKKMDGIFDTSGFIENYGGHKPLEISFKRFQKKKIEHFNDPLKDFRLNFDENPETNYFYGGTKISSKDQLKGYERKEQEIIIKENNPIEIDKVIHYIKK